jgi:phenylacetate-CoA ligase
MIASLREREKRLGCLAAAALFLENSQSGRGWAVGNAPVAGLGAFYRTGESTMNPATDAALDTLAPFQPASSLDYVPRAQLRGLQSERLRQAVHHAYVHLPVYHQRMQKRSLTPADIHDLDDLGKLPFTVHTDLSEAYPFGMLAVPVGQVVRLNPFSGMGGKPIVMAYTQRDLEVWTELLIRCLACCGIHPGDVLQNACTGELFADGLGLHVAAEALGATVIPVSGGDTDRQIMGMKDFGVSAVCSTPSYFLHLVERAEKMGVNLRTLPLRAGLFVAELWSEATRRQIEDSAGIKAYDVYRLPEVIGPGVGAECGHQNGLHIFEDHLYPEVIDPASGDVLPDGQEGELVLTTLSKQAMPLVRYRTRDVTAIIPEPCPCGRTVRRIRRIGRRSDDVFVIQGVNVFPSQIEAALLAVEGVLPRYQIVLAQEKGLDQAEVQIEVTPQTFSDRLSALEALQSKFAQAIEHNLGISVAVRLVEPHTITGHQDQRVVDRRSAPN